MRILVLVISLAFMVSACSLYTVDSEFITMEYHPAKDSPDDVQYQEQVTAPHKVIGTVKVNAERNQRREEVIRRLKSEAAVYGADAITNITIQAGEKKWMFKKMQEFFANGYVRAIYSADVVIFEK